MSPDADACYVEALCEVSSGDVFGVMLKELDEDVCCDGGCHDFLEHDPV